MARYEIELADDTAIEADDARFVADGRFLELIPRKAAVIEGAPEVLLINTEMVRVIRHTALGFKGGWRFDGERDGSFARSDGSV